MSAKPPDGNAALARFREAQDQPRLGFDSALREMQAGEKHGHWIWYVFPQLSGLGLSSLSLAYGIDGVEEAEAYLRDATLRSRLLTIATAVDRHLAAGSSIETLMGSATDVFKLVSSMTLFGHIAGSLHAGEGLESCRTLARVAADVLKAAERQGYGPCQYTMSQLDLQPEGMSLTVEGNLHRASGGGQMLLRKLHLKPGMRFAVVNAPDGFAGTLGTIPASISQEKSLVRGLDLVLLFARDRKALTRAWPRAVAALEPDGLLWIAFPKKSSGSESDLSMKGDWEVNQGSPWQPVALIAIDETWSATRFKNAPALNRRRADRQQESGRDTDGTVCIDRRNRVITPPRDLQELLDKNANARTSFEALSFTNRREYVGWIIEAKRPETRAARLTKAIAMLAKGRKNPGDK